MQAGAVSSFSPSFNSYSSTNLVDVAARVVEEFRAENDSDELYHEFYLDGKQGDFESMKKDGEYEYEDDDEEFEFEFSTKGSDSSPVSADEIFYNGKIRPVYPVFDAHLLIGGDKIQNEVLQEKGTKKIRLSLRKLFIEERETAATSSSSSSDADELEGLPVETYCVWRPKAAPFKSSSTGSGSKRWKLKDFLHRSHSEGSKQGVVLLTTSNRDRKKQSEDKAKGKVAGAVKVKSAATPLPLTSPYNRDGGEKRRTYLPYRQDLVGFFANANGF